MAGTDSGVPVSGTPTLAPLPFGALPWYDVQAAGYDVAGDGSPAATALNTLLAQIGATAATLLFRGGTYRLDANVTIPANITTKIMQGAVLSVDAARTLAINGPIDAPLSRAFSGAGVVSFAANEVVEALFPEWWHDGSGDWRAAILAAINSLNGYGSVPIRFTGAAYPHTAFAVPGSTAGAAYKALVFEGRGGPGASYQTTIRGTSAGAGVIHWDLSDVAEDATQVVFRNLAFDWGGGTATALAGTGIKLADGFHVIFDNVWLASFDIGLHLVGASFYSSFTRLRCINNFSYGCYVDGTLNGSSFRDCNFSGTLNGTGFYALGAGSNAQFSGCYFEGNIGAGLHVAEILTLRLQGCYFESNRSYDIFARSGYAHVATLITLADCYFDLGSGIAYTVANRIASEHVRWIVSGCRFYQKDTQVGAPFLLPYLTAGAPSVALNNEYDTATLTSLVDDAGWIIVDSKHVTVYPVANVPAYRTSCKRGDWFPNTDSDNATVSGWRCTSPGATADIANPALTAATVNGSAVVNASANIENPITRGDYIEIAGVTFGGGADTFAQVLAVAPGPIWTLDKNANATVGAGAVTYKRATFLEVDSLQRAGGTMTGVITTPFLVPVTDAQAVGMANLDIRTVTGFERGLVLITSRTGDQSALILFGGGATLPIIISQTAGGYFSLTPGAGGLISVYIVAGNLKIENRIGVLQNVLWQVFGTSS